MATVTNTNDSGAGSLRQAITDASSGETIEFDFGGSLDNTIVLASQIYIDKDLTINGLGADNLKISGNKASRVFEIASGSTVTIRNVAIIDGYTANFYEGGAAIYNNGITIIESSKFVANSVTFNGGAIFNYGTITAMSSVFENNSAASIGGAIFNHGTATILNSVFSGNAATESGAVFNLSGCMVVVENSTFFGNTVSSYYGGVMRNGGTAIFRNSTLSANHAARDGGAVFNDNGGILSIIRCTLSHNSANSGYDGGAIYNYNGTINIENSTLSNNSADNGGAIQQVGGDATVRIVFSTIAENQATAGAGIYNNSSKAIAVKNSIIANNIGSNLYGLISASGKNFTNSGNYSGFTTTSQLNLGPLAMNKPGTTETHALLTGSAAIDAVTDCTDFDGNMISIDQRGVYRPPVKADSGAYEFAADPCRGILFAGAEVL
ncbi:MAG: hypothetical protein LLG02_04685 [Pelosinus sp.]|nr:hypothetical protein [Pelosinus sp.]